METLHANGAASQRVGILASCALSLVLTACSALGAGGPSARAIASASHSTIDTAGIQIIDVSDAVARRAKAMSPAASFARTFGEVAPVGSIIGPGDTLEVTIFESPPAALFGNTASFGSHDTAATLAQGAGPTQRTSLPQMSVDGSGKIAIPFAGSIQAAGRTPAQVAQQIVARLNGIAHAPQVIVRQVTNTNARVAVLGEVGISGLLPLSAQGERLLDVLAAAGGTKQPVGKMTIQLARGRQVASMPLSAIVADGAQNVRLQPHDVVTAIYQPFTFTSLGATGTSAEIPFEGTGLTLSQALGRIGGLKDDRANPRGVFIFRLEDPGALDPSLALTARRTPDGLVPVIYRVDLRNPATLFVAQSFPIHNKDVLYVSTAPLSDFQRFVSVASSLAFTAIGLGQAIP